MTGYAHLTQTSTTILVLPNATRYRSVNCQVSKVQHPAMLPKPQTHTVIHHLDDLPVSTQQNFSQIQCCSKYLIKTIFRMLISQQCVKKKTPQRPLMHVFCKLSTMLGVKSCRAYSHMANRLFHSTFIHLSQL
jgi:hypothetical protein